MRAHHATGWRGAFRSADTNAFTGTWPVARRSVARAISTGSHRGRADDGYEHSGELMEQWRKCAERNSFQGEIWRRVRISRQRFKSARSRGASKTSRSAQRGGGWIFAAENRFKDGPGRAIHSAAQRDLCWI